LLETTTIASPQRPGSAAAQRIIAALAGLVPLRLKLRLIGNQSDPSRFAEAVHFIFNRLPLQRFQVLPCQGALKGYLMKVDWQKHRSYVYGTWEPAVVGAIRETVRRGMIALDVGAHGGFYTLLLSKLVGQNGRVISFEPVPANFQMLQENIILNNCLNITAVNKALGEYCGQMEMAVRGSDSSLVRGSVSRGKVDGKVVVPLISLDKFAADSGLGVQFIKIDVEGAEEWVLNGSRETIGRYHPVIVDELHGFDVCREKHPVIKQLGLFGYDIQWLSKWDYTAHVLAR
jgi:FkbM family methyltransferase